MRRSENGALSSVRLTPTACAADLSTWRPLASRRSIPQNQWTASLTLACSGSGWRRSGYSGPEQTGQDGRKEVLSKVIKRVAVRPACDRHREAEELQCGDN